MKHLIVIAGPTASGKTSLSVALAQHFNTCVLSADSRQFYKELAIGTAKPSIEEQEGVPHFFIDSHSVTDEVSAARFEKEALEVLDDEFKTKDVVILTGGSGLFIDALCEGLDDIPSSKSLRDAIQSEADQHGLAPLLDELKQHDPVYFNQVDQQNPMRIIRAIEVIRLTGKPYSEQRLSAPKQRPFVPHRFVIEHERDTLYERINQRVHTMIEQGLVAEAQSVMHHRNLASLNTVGYSELFDYFDGNISLEEAITLIQRNSRRYAKRQLTWFKRHPDAHWLNYSSNTQMIQEIIDTFNANRTANEDPTNLE